MVGLEKKNEDSSDNTLKYKVEEVERKTKEKQKKLHQRQVMLMLRA